LGEVANEQEPQGKRARKISEEQRLRKSQKQIDGCHLKSTILDLQQAVSRLPTMAKEVRVFLNLFVESKELENVTQSLVKLPEVTDVYEVTGEYDIVCMLRVENILAFRNVLKDKVLKISGVRSTVSSVVLYEHKREGKPVSD